MDRFLNVYGIVMMVIGVYVLLNSIFNIWFFKKMMKPKQDRTNRKPLVSIIIPARDEEKNLPRLLTSLTKQTYENLEVLVINDQSSDRTQEIIECFEKRDPRIHGFKTDPNVKLMKHGKMNALLQLIPHAKGEYLLATDADTEHAPSSVELAIGIMLDHDLDIFSGYPIEYCPTNFTGITVASMVLAIAMIPHHFFYKHQWNKAAIAIGQFIMMRRDAYDDVGGYAAIENEIVDDMGLVKLFVKNKKKYCFVPLATVVGCYMYSNGADAFKGIERSIIGVCPVKYSIVPALIVLVAFLLLLAWAPLFALIFYLCGFASTSLILMVVGWLCFSIGWYKCCRITRFSKKISSSCALSITLICAMYIHGVYRRLSGKNFVWKGRLV